MASRGKAKLFTCEDCPFYAEYAHYTTCWMLVAATDSERTICLDSDTLAASIRTLNRIKKQSVERAESGEPEFEDDGDE